MKTLVLDFSGCQQDFDTSCLHDLSLNGVMCHPKSEDGETPVPWDAGIEVRVNEHGIPMILMEGGAGASGFGYCMVKIPAARHDGWRFILEPNEDDEIEVKQILTENGISWTEER